jgi:hypothetical protein
MPVILPPEAWPAWLGESEVSADTLIKALVTRPYPAEGNQGILTRGTYVEPKTEPLSAIFSYTHGNTQFFFG